MQCSIQYDHVSEFKREKSIPVSDVPPFNYGVVSAYEIYRQGSNISRTLVGN